MTSLKDYSGNWIFNQEDLHSFIVNHFKNLFSAHFISDFPTYLHPPPILASFLTYDIPYVEEIKSSLMQLKPFKVPSIDGFQPFFFQNCWSSVKDLLCSDIQKAFRDGAFPLD